MNEFEVSLANCRGEFPPRLAGNKLGGISNLAYHPGRPMLQQLVHSSTLPETIFSNTRLPEAMESGKEHPRNTRANAPHKAKPRLG